VPCGPINNYQQVFEDEQVRHRGLRVDVARGNGMVGTIASPLRLQSTPPAYEQAPPLLGEHTEQVLATLLGKDPQEIAGLRERGVV
jgi:crotonobetainyl-CoA:carnitine CoA-transferase CaiB-like acyl-CoA transferase